jgi:hypothetical protein
MKIFRVRRMTLFGLGFLLGSRTGRGPWDKTVKTWNQVQDKAGASLNRTQVKEKIEQAKGKLSHSSSGNGSRGQRSDLSSTGGQMTDI